jgi:glycolate oxidase iron-sulfur subunit
MDMPVPTAAAFALKEADLCVLCGLCLPHCPTYRLSRDENESPRGRIQLMRALARGQLPLTPALEAHLDHCLACRACEAVCPAKVPYGQLIDATRAHIAKTSGRSGTRRELMNLAARPERLGRAMGLARIYQRSGLRFLARHTGLLQLLGLARYDAALPELHTMGVWKSFYPAAGPACGAVSLFLGCVARALDRETIDAAIFVLNRFGYDVHIPPGQTCCGALHQHAGDPDTAQARARENLYAFGDAPRAVLYLASGCGATLTEYPQPLASRTRDFCGFLSEAADPPSLRLDQPLTVAVHEPCTQRNVLHNADAVYALLGRVEGLDVLPLAENAVCCGGAGTYFLDEPKMADRLRENKLAAIEHAGVRTVLTSNIGCALHLTAGLRARGSAIEIIHPAVLLRRIAEAQYA